MEAICVAGTREDNVLSAGGASAGSTGATSGPLPTVSQTCKRLFSRPCKTGELSLLGQQVSMYDLYLLLERCLLRMSNLQHCQWRVGVMLGIGEEVQDMLVVPVAQDGETASDLQLLPVQSCGHSATLIQ